MRSRARRSFWQLITAGALVGTVSSCSLLFNWDRYAATDGLAAGPGADAAHDDAIAANEGPCDHAYPPPPPADAGGGTIDILLAVQSWALADAGGAGYDLDHTCTCQAPSACAPPFAGAVEGADCDGPGGRDTTGNLVLGEPLEIAFGQTPLGDVNQRIQTGYLGHLLQIRHLTIDGGATRVFVGVLDSSGIFVQGDGGTTHRQGPQWEGGDPWTIDCALSLATGCPPDRSLLGDAAVLPGFFDTNAYVTTDRTLVAHFPTLVVGLGLTTMRLGDVVLTAKITVLPDDGGIRLDGQIAGLFGEKDLFAMLATMRGFDGEFLCEGNASFDTFKTTICQSLDMVGSGPQPPSPGARCNALSIAMPFVALPGKTGFRYDGPSLVGCDAGAGCSE